MASTNFKKMCNIFLVIILFILLLSCNKDEPAELSNDINNLTVKGEKWEVTIDSCGTATELLATGGDKLYIVEEGFIFLILNLRVKNLQDQADSLHSDWTILIDNENRKYKVEGIGTWYEKTYDKEGNLLGWCASQYNLGILYYKNEVESLERIFISYVFLLPENITSIKFEFLDYRQIDLSNFI